MASMIASEDDSEYEVCAYALVARKEVSQVGAEPAEADLRVEAQRVSQPHQVPFEWPVAEDVERHLAACLLRLGEDPAACSDGS